MEKYRTLFWLLVGSAVVVVFVIVMFARLVAAVLQEIAA